jgi:hypothetical protein
MIDPPSKAPNTQQCHRSCEGIGGRGGMGAWGRQPDGFVGWRCVAACTQFTAGGNRAHWRASSVRLARACQHRRASPSNPPFCDSGADSRRQSIAPALTVGFLLFLRVAGGSVLGVVYTGLCGSAPSRGWVEVRLPQPPAALPQPPAVLHPLSLAHEEMAPPRAN